MPCLPRDGNVLDNRYTLSGLCEMFDKGRDSSKRMIATEIPTHIGGRIRIFQRRVVAMNGAGHKKYSDVPEPLNDDRIGEQYTYIRIPRNGNVAVIRYNIDPLYQLAVDEIANRKIAHDENVFEEYAGQEFRIPNELLGIPVKAAYGRDNTPTIRAVEQRQVQRNDTIDIGSKTEKQPSVVVRLIRQLRGRSYE